MRMTTLTSRGDVIDCALSADGRYLAYIAGQPGQATLRVRQVATGGDVEVRPASDAAIETPSFSPDGNYVYYRMRKADAQNYSSLQQVPSLGGASQQRAFDVDTRVTFSPDGKRLAFWRGVPQNGESHLVTVDLDSGKEHVLATIQRPETWAGGPSWSPDGRRIAAGVFVPVGALRSIVAMFDAASGRREDAATLDRNVLDELAWLRDGTGLAVTATDLKASITSQVWLMRYPGKTLERVTNDFGTYTTMSASGGEEAIAVVRNSRVQNVWVANAAGGDARQLTRASSPEQSAFGLATPDTATVVFSSPLGTGIQLWAVPAGGGEPRALTTGPAFSVNAIGGGGAVYFNRLEPSGTHVWTVMPDGTGLRQVTTDGNGEQGQTVSRDGRYLAYVRTEAPNDYRLASTADGHSSLFASSAGGSLGFSNDGTRLLISRLVVDARGVVGPVWTAYTVPGGAAVDSLRQPGDAGNVSWSPACDGICFSSSTDGKRNIFQMPFRGGARIALTHFTDGVTLFWVVSPDGSKIAIVRQVGTDTNVWVTQADGTRPVQVTRFSGQRVSQVTWLPDDRRLLVSAGVSSDDAVVIRDFR
jgi:Tol biopolymer transport system component